MPAPFPRTPEPPAISSPVSPSSPDKAPFGVRALDEALPAAPPTEGAKERIVAEAVRLFCRKGFDATPVREICAAAGVTKPVLYYYFRNKEDLFRSILDDTLGRFREEIREATTATAPSFEAKLNAVAKVYLDAARASPDLVRFINSIAFSGLYDELFDFHAYWMENMRLLEEVFAEAREKGWVRDDLSPRALAFHFNGIVLSVMRGLVYFPLCLEEYPVENVVEYALRGIAPPPADAAAERPPPLRDRTRETNRTHETDRMDKRSGMDGETHEPRPRS